MGGKGIALLSLFSVVCLATGALAAAPGAAGSDLDEVVITGKRAKLDELRKEIARSEDRFYARYNELNARHEFDIHCSNDAPTGTQLKMRSCQAVYQERALQEEGKQGIEGQQFYQSQPGPPAVPNPVMPGPPVPAKMAIEARRPEFRKNMREVVSRNKELAGMLRERAQLIDRYNALRREVFGSKPPPTEKADVTAAP